MILYNTTFYIDRSINSAFIEWLRQIFIVQAVKYGLENPMLARICTPKDENADDGTVSYALHLYAKCDNQIADWIERGVPPIMRSMHDKWGELALAFSTSMEIIDFK